MGCTNSTDQNLASNLGSNSSSSSSISSNKNLDTYMDLFTELDKATIENTKPIKYDFKYAKVLSVYDGDTITIAAMHNNTLTQFRVRIFGIDAPEIRGGTEETKHNAQESKKYLDNMICGKIVELNILDKDDERIQRMDPFGRLLAEVWLMQDGHKKSIAEEMLKRGLAEPYFGGIKSKVKKLRIEIPTKPIIT